MQSCGFCISGGQHREIKEILKVKKVLNLPKAKKTVEHEGQGYAIYSWCTRNGTREPEKETGGIENP